MKNLEANKIAAAILVAGLMVLTISKLANFLYEPERSDKRGFQVEGAGEQVQAAGDDKKEEKIDIPALMAKADAAQGEVVFKKCASCHSNDAGGAHKIGPNLHGVFNAAIAHHDNFSYSAGMKQKGGHWDTESLFGFLKKPRDYIPGTKMTFPGLKDPKEIANVVKYLEQN